MTDVRDRAMCMVDGHQWSFDGRNWVRSVDPSTDTDRSRLGYYQWFSDPDGGEGEWSMLMDHPSTVDILDSLRGQVAPTDRIVGIRTMGGYRLILNDGSGPMTYPLGENVGVPVDLVHRLESNYGRPLILRRTLRRGAYVSCWVAQRHDVDLLVALAAPVQISVSF